MKEFIGGRNYIGLQQPQEAEAFVIGVPCGYRERLHGYPVRKVAWRVRRIPDLWHYQYR
jgi:hypothetical protein